MLFKIYLVFMFIKVVSAISDICKPCQCSGEEEVTLICDIIQTKISPKSLPNNLNESKISEIKYKGQNITYLEENYFKSNLPKLWLLRFEDCNIQKIHKRFLIFLPNLEYLHLDNNFLQELDKDIFKNNINLHEIRLAKNKLKYLDPAIFKNLTKLEYIYLSHNQLVEIPNNLFSFNKELWYIYLDNNKLSFLDKKVFENLNDLIKLSLKGNPWHCDCLLTEFQKHFIQSNFKDNPMCETPFSQINKSWYDLKFDEICGKKVPTGKLQINLPKVEIIKYEEKFVAGQNVTLQCHSDVANITWKRNNRVIKNEEGKYLVTDNRKTQKLTTRLFLTIFKINKTDEGLYR